MTDLYISDLYKELCTSKFNFVKYIKDYIKSPKKVMLLAKLEENTELTEKEKMLIYLFIDRVVRNKCLFIRKCDECNIEWFSTKKHAVLCEKCRPVIIEHI